MYEYRNAPAPIDPNEPHTRAKFAYYREAESRINAGPVVVPVTYHPLPANRRRAVAACGTPSGVARHKRENTEKCGPCLDAIALYQREYRHAKKARG